MFVLRTLLESGHVVVFFCMDVHVGRVLFLDRLVTGRLVGLPSGYDVRVPECLRSSDLYWKRNVH